jgi:hypothetical protein
MMALRSGGGNKQSCQYNISAVRLMKLTSLANQWLKARETEIKTRGHRTAYTSKSLSSLEI